jgi:hypothetical protein
MSLYLTIGLYFGPPLLFVIGLFWFSLSMRRRT